MSKKGVKGLVFVSIIYLLILAGMSAFFIVSGRTNYLGFKKEVDKARSEVKTSSSLDTTDSSNSSSAAASTTVNNNTTNANTNTDNSNSSGSATASSNEKSSPASSSSTDSTNNTYANVKFSRTISINAQGDDVKRVQYLLKSKNLYLGNITGTYDANTQEAVKAFQKSMSIGQDGVIGPSTWAKLNQ